MTRNEDAAGRIETLFREQSGRMVATLVRILGVAHLDLVEETVQEAFVEALRRWPYHGIPDNPSAWLIQVAKNRALDHLRRSGLHRDKEPEIVAAFERLGEGARAGDDAGAADVGLPREVRDDQLRMIFACCHPSLGRDEQVALTLKTVGGFGVSELAGAFLVKPATMAQRLVRAKRRLRDADVRLTIPDPGAMAERLEPVLDVIYLLFTGGYAAYEGESLVRPDLCREAIRLGRLVARHRLTESPAVHALAALLHLQGARLAGRTDATGEVVLLPYQNRDHWDRPMIEQGIRHLRAAAAGERLTEYHLQAEIAAHHVGAVTYAATDWPAILSCYDALIRINASPVIALNRAVALAQVRGNTAGLAEIDRLDAAGELRDYYPLHVARGELLAALGRTAEADTAFTSALELTGSDPVRRHLRARLSDRAAETGT